MPRKIEMCKNRLRIGHSQLTHNFLTNKDDPPICLTCGVQLYIKHILTECLTYEKLRAKANISEHLCATLSYSQNSINSIFNFIVNPKINRLGKINICSCIIIISNNLSYTVYFKFQ